MYVINQDGFNLDRIVASVIFRASLFESLIPPSSTSDLLPLGIVVERIAYPTSRLSNFVADYPFQIPLIFDIFTISIAFTYFTFLQNRTIAPMIDKIQFCQFSQFLA